MVSMLPVVTAPIAILRAVPGDEEDEAREREDEAQRAEEDAKGVNHG